MALDFPASSASPWTAPNGVIYTWNADGYWEAKADPNDFDSDYLKLNATNGPVTGDLTFEQQTTHENGVDVTGGNLDVANRIKQGTTTAAAAAGSGVVVNGRVATYVNETDYPEADINLTQPFQVISAPDSSQVKSVKLSLNASGSAYFAGLTEHAGGVKVTGGDVANGPGFYAQTSGNINISNNAGERIASFATSGRVGFPQSTTAAGLYISNKPDTSANVSYGIWLNLDWSNASGTSVYGVNANSYDGPGTLNTFAGYRASGTADSTKFAAAGSVQAGFLAKDTISGAAAINAGFYSEVSNVNAKNFGFYSSGSASNYFAGQILLPGSSSSIYININPIDGAPNDPFTRDGGTELKQGRCRLSNKTNHSLELKRETDGILALFYQGAKNVNAQKGSISVNAAGVSFNETSDYRLKSNVVDLFAASEIVKTLQPRSYSIGGLDNVFGFIAHELQAVVPRAVTGEKDEEEAIGTLADYDGTELETEVIEPPAEELEYTEEVTEMVAGPMGLLDKEVTKTVTRTRTWTPTGTQPVYQGVDQTKLIPLLTKALQEALERIEALEAAAAGDAVKGTTRKKK